MNYYPFHIGDYAAHTQRLSLMEDLAYRRMIDAYYLDERPFNGCAADVARAIGMLDQMESVEYVLGKFFQHDETGFSNTRCDEEIAHYHDKQAKASSAGRASAERRLKQKSTSVEKTATDEQLTNNQEPITNSNSVTEVTGGKPPLTPDEIIFGYGLPILTNAGTAEKQARSFLGGLRKAHGDDALVNSLRECIRAKPLQPLEWLAKAMPPQGADGRKKPNKQEALEARNKAIADAWVSEQGEEIESV